jgi:4-amino-4-deoxy-L-arabinose transferase-like glycosyltransferase
VFAVWYANVTPYREAGRLKFQGGAVAGDIGAPDERQHVNYVNRLIRAQGFPVLGDPGEDPYENYQAHQPPLYYLAAAGYSRLFGMTSLNNPAQGRSLRGLNALIGAIGVIGAAFLGFWATKRVFVGAWAAAFVALLPMNVALSGAVSNDPLLIALSTWALAFMVRASDSGWCWGAALRVGLLTGLALLTKSNALALFLVLPAFYLAERTKTKSPRITLYFSAALLIALITVMPWWLRNKQLYGDALALKAFEAAFTGSPSAEMFIAEFGTYGYWSNWVLWWTSRSFIGVFGYMDVFLPNEVYFTAFGVLAALFVAALFARRSPDQEPRASLWPLALYSILVAFLFIRFNMRYFQGQARYLLPAIGPMALWLAMGAERISGKFHWIGFAVSVAILIGFNVYVAQWVLPAEFATRLIAR